jgi:hypothetical protein
LTSFGGGHTIRAGRWTPTTRARAIICLFILWVTLGCAVGLWREEGAKRIPLGVRIVAGAALLVAGVVGSYFLMTDPEVAWCFRSDHPLSCGAPGLVLVT